jgi:hypothetical protein
MKKSNLLLLILFVPSVTFGQTYKNNKYNFSLKFPVNKGWSKPAELMSPNEMVKKPIELIVLSVDKNNRKVMVQVIDNKKNISMGSKSYREGFKSAILKNQPRVRVVSEKLARHAGVRCYQLTFIGTIQGSPTYMRMMALNAGRYQYNIIGISTDTTKKTDPSLEKILSSFAFTGKVKSKGKGK